MEEIKMLLNNQKKKPIDHLVTETFKKLGKFCTYKA